MHRAPERLCTWLNHLAAGWLMLIAVVIFVEVAGRGVFDAFFGGDEIVANSVPAIVFLQVPLAILTGRWPSIPSSTTCSTGNTARTGRVFRVQVP